MDLIDLDRCVQHPARVVILMALFERAGGWTFPEVRERFGFTDGNLNRHLKVLIEGGWVESERKGRGRGSSTRLTLSMKGRDGLEALGAWCIEVSGRLGIREEADDVLEEAGKTALVDDRSRDWIG